MYYIDITYLTYVPYTYIYTIYEVYHIPLLVPQFHCLRRLILFCTIAIKRPLLFRICTTFHYISCNIFPAKYLKLLTL